MAYFRCGSGSGGVDLPTKYWHGNIDQYNALGSYDSDTLYHVEKESRNGDPRYIINATEKITIGDKQIFPYPLDDYDFYLENIEFSDINNTGVNNTDYEINTGLHVTYSENIDRDFQIEFKATLSTTASLSGDQVICGVGSNSYCILKEVYFDTSGNLCISGNNISDTQYVSDANGHDIKLVFSRSNNTLTIYKDGDLAYTINDVGVPSSSTLYDLGIARYSNRYRFHGTLNYFKFKWLT